MLPLIGGSIARAVGGGLVKGAAKGAVAKSIGGGGGKKGMGPRGSNKKGQQSSAITITPKTALIPASSIESRQSNFTSDRVSTAKPKSTGTGGDTLQKINSEVIEIKKLLGKSVKEEKTSLSNKKKLLEKERRGEKENKLEKGKKIGTSSGGLSKLVPGGGIVDAIKNFIFSIIGGKILIFLLENRETVFNIVKGLAAATEFLITLGGTVLDGIVSMVDGAYNISEAIKKEINGVGGGDASKEYSNFLGKFNKFINLAMILAMAGTPGNLKGLLQGGKPGNLAGKPIKLPGGKTVNPKGFAGFSNKGAKGGGAMANYMNRSRATKLFERKYGSSASTIFQNKYNQLIQQGKTPNEALRRAKADVMKGIRNKKIIPKSAGPGLRGGPGGRVATGRAGGVFRRGLGRAGSRLQTRVMGRGARLATNRAGLRLASKISRLGSGPLGRIPIIGPLMVGIASYMEDGKLDRALFKAGGAAIGGFLGTFIPIPFLGSIIGTFAGEYVGDLFYELIRGGGVKAVGERLKADIMKVVNGVKLFSDWMVKGVSNIQKQEGPEIDLSWIPFSNFGKIRLGGWATLLNPLELNPIKKFDVLRKAFFSESMMPEGRAYQKETTDNTNTRGNSDQDDPNNSGGASGPSVTKGGGRFSLPNATGTISKVPFLDPKFNPGKTRGKSTQIYLHWTASSYNDASLTYGYHTIFGGDGTIYRNKSYDAKGSHTEGKNGDSVGLSLAAMLGAKTNNFGSQPVTQEQLNAMAAEAARLAIKWGWEEGDIDKNVWTHAEAGAGRDPRGLSGHLDENGDGSPDNYGPVAWGGLGSRWDLWMLRQGAKEGSGGPEIRDMIKKHYRNFKSELEGDKRGTNDSEGPEAKSRITGGSGQVIPNKTSLEKWLNTTDRGSNKEYNITGVGNYVRGTMFGGAPYDKLFLYPGAKEFKDRGGVVKGITRIRTYLERNYPNLISDKIIDDRGMTKRGAGLPGNRTAEFSREEAKRKAEEEKAKIARTTTTDTEVATTDLENTDDDSSTTTPTITSNIGSGLDFTTLSDSGALTDIFADARRNIKTIPPTPLNRDRSLRSKADYEETGTKLIVAYQPLITQSSDNATESLTGARIYS